MISLVMEGDAANMLYSFYSFLVLVGIYIITNKLTTTVGNE